jgi:signal transduction histidine kinase
MGPEAAVSLKGAQRDSYRQTHILLWCGFGGLLLLMAILGISAFSFLRQIEVRQEEIRKDYVERDRTLENIRAAVYISGTYMRDYLLDTNEEIAGQHKASFFEARGRMESGVAAYSPLVRPGERAVFDQFKKELRAYLDTVSPALNWTLPERRAQGSAFVENEVLPKRMLAVDLTDRLHELSEQQLKASSQEVSSLFSSFRTRLVLLFTFTIGAGLTLAGLSLRRIFTLERESEIRFRQIVATQDELKGLSAELLSAQESERRKISRELHDEVGQVLSACMLGLGNLRAAIQAGNSDEAIGQLQMVEDMTQRNAAAVRNIALLLRPTMLDDLGLVPALAWLAREISRTSGIHIDVIADSTGDVPENLPEDHRTCVFRVVQEAVHNASRHSGARNVEIRLERAAGDRLRVSVQDDGKGFEPRRETGLGILGMEERVLRLGGKIDVDSEPGRGTIVRFELPLPNMNNRDYVTRPLRTA